MSEILIAFAIVCNVSTSNAHPKYLQTSQKHCLAGLVNCYFANTKLVRYTKGSVAAVVKCLREKGLK